MTAFGRAYVMHLRNVASDLLETIRDIPEEDFNTWKPAAAREGGHEMNTFAAIAIHAVSAGEFITLHAVGGAPSQRDREAEFQATGSFREIEERVNRWVEATAHLVTPFTDEDLDREPYSERYTSRGWRAAEVLLHALDHTALHVGHLQVQRQLWDHERAG